VASGEVELNGQTLAAGDGAAVEQEAALSFAAQADSHLLLFDLR
jgi:redox-sensitive bicupin YhaK (pirin superfamily)